MDLEDFINQGYQMILGRFLCHIQVLRRPGVLRYLAIDLAFGVFSTKIAGVTIGISGD